jgi:hypothetical protein
MGRAGFSVGTLVYRNSVVAELRWLHIAEAMQNELKILALFKSSNED